MYQLCRPVSLAAEEYISQTFQLLETINAVDASGRAARELRSSRSRAAFGAEVRYLQIAADLIL